MKKQEVWLSIKKILKRILPPPVNSFNREIQRVLDKVDESRAEEYLHKIEEISQIINKNIICINDNKNEQDRCLDEINKLKQLINKNYRHIDEITWAHIFNSTIEGSEWLLNRSFSPGRAAVGYPFLYVLYRILNDIKPKNILELGLGQSTKMIGQYAEFEKIDHYVVEHDQSWVDFFKKGFTLSKYTEIVLLKNKMEPYKNAKSVRVYDGFEYKFKEIKLDLICIDAPLGYDMKEYSRIDILKLLPECLNESFIIMIDDYQRKGEKNTVIEIEDVLKSCSIKYSVGVYSGDKDLCLICSDNLKFLCSL